MVSVAIFFGLKDETKRDVMDKTTQLEEAIITLLRQCQAEKFYGSLEFKFRDGAIYQIFKGQSIRPEDLV